MNEININKVEQKLKGQLKSLKSKGKNRYDGLIYVEIEEDFSKYEGFIRSGMKHGIGLMTIGKYKTYLGWWENDHLRKGVITDDVGNKYSGNLQDFQRDGYGRQEWVDGTYYEGEWKSNTRHGRGFLVFPNETIMRGNWFFDLPNNIMWKHSRGKVAFVRDFSIDDQELTFLPVLDPNSSNVSDYETGLRKDVMSVTGFQVHLIGYDDVGIPSLGSYSFNIYSGDDFKLLTPDGFGKNNPQNPTILIPKEIRNFNQYWRIR